MSKAAHLIPKIIEASDKNQAVEVLYDLLQTLHLSQDYTSLVKIKDELDEKAADFDRIIAGIEGKILSIDELNNFRWQLSLLYREISDKFSFKINKTKIYFEESRGTIKADSFKEIKDSPELSEELGVKSTSALKDFLHYSGIYREYTSNYSIAYGLYKQLDGLLSSIQHFINYTASKIKSEQEIEKQN